MSTLEKVEAIAKKFGRRQGWLITQCFGSADRDGGVVVERDDEAAKLAGDGEAIALARAAGIECDDRGRVFGLHPLAGS